MQGITIAFQQDAGECLDGGLPNVDTIAKDGRGCALRPRLR